MKTLILISLVITTSLVFSQTTDTLLLINGKLIKGTIEEINYEKVKIKCNNRLLFKLKTIHKQDVFSVTSDNKTLTWYKKDTINGHYYSQIQMKYFLDGVIDAKANYHAPFATIGGLAMGITGGFYGFWGAFIPTSYVFTSGIKTPKLEKTILQNEHAINLYAKTNNNKYGQSNDIANDIILINDQPNYQISEYYFDFYKEGYETTAKDKKIKNAIKGSVIGFIGFAAITSILYVFR
jgi:hypothetical protein